MDMHIKQKKFREKNIIITILFLIMICACTFGAYLIIYNVTEQRCIERMQEAADTVAEDIGIKLSRDSSILHSVAEIIAMQDTMDVESMQGIIAQFTPLTVARQMNLLLPGDILISQTGRAVDVTGQLSYEKEVAFGEHITDRTVSLVDDNRLVIRHFVPIKKDGKIVALLYSTTDLKELPDSLNIGNIYNGSGEVYLVDRSNGDMLMDTLHDHLGNIWDFASYEAVGNKSITESHREVLDGKSGYNIFRSEITGENAYCYYTPIDETKWVQIGDTTGINEWSVIVEVPEKIVLANLYSIRRICFIIGVIETAIILIYFIWILRNTSATMEKAILEERLIKAENAERAKTRFLSSMSHDIRTPMNAIIGFTTLAAAHAEDPAKVRDYLSKILSSSNHLLSLINDILDMSRIESGKVEIEETECSLPDILLDLRNIIINQVHAKQLDLYIDTIDVIDEDIYCDKLHLNQVLLNLLSNAVKFTPAGGAVSLIIKQKHGAPEGYAKYEIRVKDTGIGMSPEFVKHVFEPFERESTSTVSGIQGTGLGMAIAKNIVDMMGGTIEVSSEQGKGTEYVLTFDFRLQSERRQIEVIKELEGMRALVVDDDYDICDSVTKMLVQLGMRADWTLSGKEAVLHAKHAAELGDVFSAYIIDLYMPDMNGLEVVRRIRGAIGDDVPIIILTAYDWGDIEDEAKKAGVTAFCNKPIFASTLRETLVSSICTHNNEEEAEAVLPSAADELQGKRLLLVEDNELNREIAVEILTAGGFLVETACDGTEAVDIMKKTSAGYFDMILMDIQMPIMNGYDATKAIRALEKPGISDIPIIAMTANAFDEDKQRALISGMNDHLAKPLDMDKLFTMLYKYLKK